MNTKLKLFTDAGMLARTSRPILTRFLEDYQAHLSAEAGALLAASLNGLTYEEYCSAWARQFGAVEQFGAPLWEALQAIEVLAQPENAAVLDEALSHLPPGYEINRGFSRLHQALHLWLIAHSPVGVQWPVRSGDILSPGSKAPGTANEPSQSDEPGNSEHPHASPPAPAAAEGGAIALSSSTPPLTALASHTSGEETSDKASPPCGDWTSPPQSPPEEDPAAELDAEALAVAIRRVKPWREPLTDAPALFDQVHDRALQYLFLPPGAAVVFALWPGHAYAVKAFTHSPRLYVTSAEPGCGKTTALDFIACLCPDVLRTDNIRPAVLFRLTDKHEPTLVLDEFDSYADQHPELRGLINAGHNLHGCAMRCEGPNVRFFRAYAATALAGLGELAPTLADRSIIIRLAEAPRGALRARFDRRHTKFETMLGRKIARWVQDNYAAIAACEPVMPPEVLNRLADNWRPLFAVAQVIGGHWPQRVSEAFKQLTAKPAVVGANGNGGVVQAVPATTVQLLTDIRELFVRSATERLFSSTLVKLLRLVPERPWSGGHNGNGLTEARLAQQLVPLGIVPRKIMVQGQRARGYRLADFKPAFALLGTTELNR